MQIIFTTSGPVARTLADDTATPRIAAVIESWSGSAVVQSETLYNAASQALFARGNVAGQFGFTSDCSYADADAAVAAFAAAYALLGLQGTLAVKPKTTTATFPRAILKDVARQYLAGCRLIIRYSFTVTTCTAA